MALLAIATPISADNSIEVAVSVDNFTPISADSSIKVAASADDFIEVEVSADNSIEVVDLRGLSSGKGSKSTKSGKGSKSTKSSKSFKSGKGGKGSTSTKSSKSAKSGKGGYTYHEDEGDYDDDVDRALEETAKSETVRKASRKM